MVIRNTLSIISYMRIIYVYAFIIKINKYFGSRIGRLLKIYGHRTKATNIKYAVKCLFKKRGFFSNIFLFLFAIGFLGMVTTQLSASDDTFLDGIYLALVTMTTVGYG